MSEGKAIPSEAEWKALPTKQDRKEMLTLIRREFPDSEIREAWGMKPGTFYNILNRYGMTGKRAKKVEEGESTIKEKAPKKEQPEAQERPQRGDGPVLEAEYTVVEDEGPAAHSRSLTVVGATGTQLDFPFPTVRGTSKQLRKQFEAVVMFLEALEDEETRFEINIQVYKA
jgi:hypothetical protein